MAVREVVLRITGTDGDLSAALVTPDGSSLGSSPIQLDLSPDDPGDSEDYGTALWRAVLAGPVGDALRMIGPTRVRIVAGEAGVTALRWERLVEPGAELHTPLAVDPRTPLSRLLFPDSVERAREPETSWPLRIVVAISSPASLGGKALPLIDKELEWAEIQRALRPLQGLIEVIPTDSPVTLNQIAQTLECEPHIFHFLGHGFFDRSTGTAALYLESESSDMQHMGPAAPVPQDEWIGRWATLTRKPHLVVLSACESAAKVNRGALVGMAPSFLHAGSSAVLAMADKVGTDVAREFIYHFYRRLATHGEIDLASNEARSYLYDRAGWNWNWSIPTAFVERGAERIFAQTPDALEAEPAHSGEVLVLIPEFRGHEEAFFEYELRERLQSEVEGASLGDVRVVWLEKTVLGPGSEDDVRRLAARYGATLVVWGWYDASGLRACFTVTESLFAYRDPTVLKETVSVRDDLGSDRNFAIVVNQDLPRQVDYFVFFALAQLHYWAGHYDESLRALDRAIDAALAAPAARRPEGLEFAYFYRGNLHAVYRQDRQAAIADYRSALAEAPTFAVAAYNLGQAFRVLGDTLRAQGEDEAAQDAYRQGIESYGRALQADDGFIDAYADRGLAHWEVGESKLAVADYQKALDLDPEAETYNRLGAALYALGKERWHEAMIAFDTAINRAPSTPSFHFNRGRLRAELEETVGAREDLKEYLRLAPNANNRARVEEWLQLHTGSIPEGAELPRPGG